MPAHHYSEKIEEKIISLTDFADDIVISNIAKKSDKEEKGKAALVIPHPSSEVTAKDESILLKVLELGGFDPYVYMNKRSMYKFWWDFKPLFLRGPYKIYNKMGFDNILYPNSILEKDEVRQIKDLVPEKAIKQGTDLEEIFNFTYQDVPLGEYIVGSYLREKRIGWKEKISKKDEPVFYRMTFEAIKNYFIAKKLDELLSPRLIVTSHQGYVLYGPYYYYFLRKNIPVLVHKPPKSKSRGEDMFIFKKHEGLKDWKSYPLGIGDDTWKKYKKEEVTSKEISELKKFFENRFNKSNEKKIYDSDKGFMMGKKEVLDKLGIKERDKIVVIFPHLAWDSSFYYGENLFTSYNHWLIETLKVSKKKENITWIVKSHPAEYKFKNYDYSHKNAEKIVGGEDHVNIIPPDSDLNTYSLIPITNLAVTVRGTIGIEFTPFGVPVLMGGEAYYSNKGFTIDPKSKEEYLNKLRNIDSSPTELSPEQKNLARKYSYLIFVNEKSIKFPSEEVSKNQPIETVQEYLEENDINDIKTIKKFLEWIENDQEDFMPEEFSL